MNKIQTNYSIDNKKVSYEILEDGYKIYLEGNDNAWIHQYEPYIPNREMSYEENAVAQIEEIIAMQEASIKAQQKAEQEKAELLEQVALQDEAINELASLVSELMMAKEVE